jgi:hypothetical protein
MEWDHAQLKHAQLPIALIAQRMAQLKLATLVLALITLIATLASLANQWTSQATAPAELAARLQRAPLVYPAFI